MHWHTGLSGATFCTLGADKCNASVQLTLKINNRYEGNWLGDERHGQGTYIYASGGSYRGGWAEGWMHGLGCYTSVNGARYEGMYR